MFKSKILRDEIIFRLSIMETCLNWHSTRGHNDLCKEVERVIGQFLAPICGWNLEVLEERQKNYPAVDLGDFTARVAIQVTVNDTTEKIRDVHNKARTHNLGADFDRIIILFLNEKTPKAPNASNSFSPYTDLQIECWARPHLDQQLDAVTDAQLEAALKVLHDKMPGIKAILNPSMDYRPSNLPYTSLGTLFKGRETFISDLRSALTNKSAAVIKGHAIHGMGGVGKTRAAIEYGWRYFFEYRAILFVTADSPDAFRTSLASLCDASILDLPEKSSTDHNTQVQSVLQWLQRQQGWLLIVDNADTREALETVRGNLNKLSSGHVIITTRQDRRSGDLETLDLDVLTQLQSAEFLMEWTEKHRSHLFDDEEAAKELATLLDGLALALQQAAAYISECRISFHEYLVRWKNHTADALAWHDKDSMNYPVSLAITYETSVSQLSKPANKLLQVLSWLSPDPFPFSALNVLNHSADQKICIAELENLHLARRRNDGIAFSIHRLVQEITRQQQVSDNHPPALINAAKWIDHEIGEDPSNVANWPSYNILVPHAQAVASSCEARKLYTESMCLFNQVGLIYRSQAKYKEAEPLLRKVVELEYIRAGNPSPISLNNLALLLVDMNSFSEAESLYQQSLSLLDPQAPKDQEIVTIILRHFGKLLYSTERFEEAERTFRKVLSKVEHIRGHNDYFFSSQLNDLGELLLKVNRLIEAEEVITRALEILKDSDSEAPGLLAGALNNLGQVLEATERLNEAEVQYRKALHINEKQYPDGHPTLAVGLNNLAGILDKLGRPGEAEPLLRRALAIDEFFHGPYHSEVATDLLNLGSLLSSLERGTEAELLKRRALQIKELVFGENHSDVAMTCNNLGVTLQQLGKIEEAEILYRRAVNIYHSSLGEEHPEVACALTNLAGVLGEGNRLHEADSCMRRAIRILVQDSILNKRQAGKLTECVNSYATLRKQMGDSPQELRFRINKLIKRFGYAEHQG
ncbi:tetratricopeptide repeat protein [Prosthecobacter fusiformis]|uniref:Tetratricopeptide repeat protein n=2 Tax=Prosthecobacter fusiformis TaxID=48464 RepID=A0A4R7RYC3_9BACT|nr:tetratricopeptide repeat protein [Prosthecobacter fusiformis]